MWHILKHANSEWQEQRSSCAKIFDPRNQGKMKRRKVGVVHTNWDNIWVKWGGSQRWWKASKDWKSFTRTATDLSQRDLVKEEDEKKGIFRGRKGEMIRKRLTKKGRRP